MVAWKWTCLRTLSPCSLSMGFKRKTEAGCICRAVFEGWWSRPVPMQPSSASYSVIWGKLGLQNQADGEESHCRESKWLKFFILEDNFGRGSVFLPFPARSQSLLVWRHQEMHARIPWLWLHNEAWLVVIFFWWMDGLNDQFIHSPIHPLTGTTSLASTATSN